MKSGYRRYLAIAAWAAWGIASGAAQAQLIDLGVATAHAINNSGQVALDQGIYSDGTIKPLPALPGGSTPAAALAINASGWAAGNAIAPASVDYPVAYINGSLIDIVSSIFISRAAQNSGTATGINSSGEVVGWFYAEDELPGAPTFGITYLNGTITSMTVPCPGTPAEDCSGVADNTPYGINDSGKITGTVIYNVNDDYVSDAYISFNGTWTDLGPGAGYAINAAGQVTGQLDNVVTSGSAPNVTSRYAFLYANGITTNLGTLPGGKNSVGSAINATGQIVGSSDYADGSVTHAFFFNGVMTDLNALISSTDPLQPYVTLTAAVGINDKLLIVANGVDSRTGENHAYLLQAPFIQIAPAALSFGTEAVGGTTQSQSITVTNSGTTAIPLGAISTSSNYSLKTNSCTTSLAPSGQCTVTIAFAPVGAGAASGELTIAAAGTNYAVALSGVAPITAALSGSATTMTVGQSVTLTWSASPGSKCAAASGPTKSAFSGAIEVGGSLKVTQTTAGTETYQIQCTAVGTPEVDSPTVSVVWTWPAVTATISASPTTLTAGQSTTLTWKSANATSCTATGGGADDNWAGTKATSGSQAVTEAVALDAASVLTFGITCNSTASGLSDKASVNVTENPAPASSGGGGGGGALNPVSLVFLAGILALRRVRGRIAGGLDGLRWASVGSEYDPRKSAENKRKQGIDFEEAQALWSDPGLLEISQQAPRKSDRFPAYSWGTLAQLRSMKRPEL